MKTANEPTAYGVLFNALCDAGARRIAECPGFNEGQSFELWIVPGRQQPVLIHTYDDGGFQDYHPNPDNNTQRTIDALLSKGV
jgi:anti-sigma-K factor RskA